MARPVDMARRREIAARAFEVVKDRGVHRVTMSDIAKVLQMKRSTLYWYFPDLSAVFEATFDDLQQRVMVHATQAMGRQQHPIDQLDALITAVIEFYENERDVLMGMLQLWAVASGDPEQLLAREREYLKPQRDFLVKLVDFGIRQGRVAPCDAEGLVDMVLTLVDGTNMQRVAHDPDFSPMVDFVRKHVLAPLKLEPEVK